MNPAITKNKADDNTNSSNDNTTTNWWIMVATIVIAIFAGCQFVAMFLQYCAMTKQVKRLQDSIELTQQSVDLTRQEFVSSHPPKLRVHSVVLFSPLEVGSTWRIECSIDNIGGSPARIVERDFNFKKLDPIPPKPPYELVYDNLTLETSIEPGEGTIEFLRLKDKIKFTIGIAQTERQDFSGFYFFGYVDYLDDFNTKRHIAFCRHYNARTGHFFKISYEDYEYDY
jgi:hypothetical protein